MLGVKDSVFEASSTYRHTTELNNLLTTLNDSDPMLMLYTMVDLTIELIFCQFNCHT